MSGLQARRKFELYLKNSWKILKGLKWCNFNINKLGCCSENRKAYLMGREWPEKACLNRLELHFGIQNNVALSKSREHS